MSLGIMKKIQSELFSELFQNIPFQRAIFSHNFFTNGPHCRKSRSIKDVCFVEKGEKNAKKKWFQWNLRKSDEKVRQKKGGSLQEESKLCEEKKFDPDLTGIGGTPYRTCGTAYIIQKHKISVTELADSEDELVAKLEKHPEVKNNEDIMPPFESVEKRMIDLNERKLHPLYKKYIDLPKKSPKVNVAKFIYKSRSGPVSGEEIPARLKIEKELLEKKNIFSDFKKVEPPRQILAKMLEIQLNQKPTMETRMRRNKKGTNSNETTYLKKIF